MNSRLGYINKEKDYESGLHDHGVRKYDDLSGRFISVDPLWSKYIGWTQYQYSFNDPINFKDFDGNAVYGTDMKSQEFIKVSVESEYEGLVQFNKNGSLNTNECKDMDISESSNMGKLLYLNNLKDKIEVSSVDENDEIKGMTYSMSKKSLSTSTTTLKEAGADGLARMPIKDFYYDNIPMSIDKNAHIYLNKKTATAKTAAHELFYHTYLFFNKNQKSHYSWFTDHGLLYQSGKYDSQLDKKVQNAAVK